MPTVKLTPLQKNIINAIQREDKSGAWYLLQRIDHKKYFYQYDIFYTKPEIKKLLFGYVLTMPEKFSQFETFKKYFLQ